MALNFNVDPYYDDFDPTKNFHRILFKPGFAVQARELTQAQTILQNQITNFADNIFKQNTPITGGKVTTNLNCYYLKLNPTFNNNTIVAANFNNKLITDSTGAIVAKVIATVESTGSSSSVGDPPTLIVTYRSGVQFKDATTLFTADGFAATTIGNSGGVTCTGLSSAASISQGIFYIVTGWSQSATQNADGTYSKYSIGNFVSVSPQTVVLSKYNNTPSIRIGLEVNEDIVDYINDPSLLDPAIGASNYQAPGADRYQVNLTLVTLPLTLDVNDPQFIELVRLNGGQVVKQVSETSYSVIDDYFAKRDYETNGDYVVNDFKLTPSSIQGDNTNWNLTIGPGVAYVRGYRIENQSPITLTSPRAQTTASVPGNSIHTDYGNYFITDTLSGIFDYTTMPQVDFHCVPASQIGATASLYKSTLVGTGFIRNMVFQQSLRGVDTSGYTFNTYVNDISCNTLSGTCNGTSSNTTLQVTDSSGLFSNANNAYLGAQLVLNALPTGVIDTPKIVTNYTVVGSTKTFTVDNSFTINPTNTTAFSLVFQTNIVESIVQKNVSYQLTANTNVSSFGKVNGSLTGSTILFNSSTPELVFKIGSSYVANVASSNYFTTKIFRGLQFDSVSKQITVTAPTGMNFATTFGSGSYGPTIASSYMLIDSSTGNILDFSTSGNTVSVTSTSASFQSSFFQSKYSGATIDVFAQMHVTNGEVQSNYILKSKNYISGNTSAVGSLTSISGSTTQYSVSSGVASGQTYIPKATISGNTSLSLYVTDVDYITKIVDLGTNGVAPSAGALLSSYTDVTNYFTFNNGQKDSFYDFSSISLLPGVNPPTGDILVVYNYYSHNYSGSTGDGYFSVQSYPNYNTIPTYVAKNGNVYNLRDCIDFRPARLNGSSSSSYTWEYHDALFSHGILIPTPGNSSYYQNNYTYYLSRKDKLVVTKDGNFAFIYGNAAVNSILPTEPKNTLVLATFYLDPYTANIPGTADLTVPANITVNKILHKRWAKSDITDLQTRVNNLEYYTSLSALESNAQAMQIPDVNGLNRFKNGILVDDFSNYGVCNSDFTAGFLANINIRTKKLTSINQVENFQLQNPLTLIQGQKAVNTYKIHSIGGTGTNIYTLPYTTANVVTQRYASNTVSINPFSISLSQGVLALIPPADNWYNTYEIPAIMMNTPAYQFSQIARGNSLLNCGDAFSVVGLATSTSDMTFTGVSADYMSQLQSILAQSTSSSAGGALSNNNGFLNNNHVLPYIRPQEIGVICRGMLKNTPVDCWFDGVNVNQYMITPDTIELSNSYGTFLEDDVIGFYETNISSFIPIGRVMAVHYYPNSNNCRLYLSSNLNIPSYVSSTLLINATFDLNGNYIGSTANGSVIFSANSIYNIHTSGHVTNVGGTFKTITEAAVVPTFYKTPSVSASVPNYVPFQGINGAGIVDDGKGTFFNTYAIWGDQNNGTTYNNSSSPFTFVATKTGTFSIYGTCSGTATVYFGLKSGSASAVMSLTAPSTSNFSPMSSASVSLVAGSVYQVYWSANSSGKKNSGIAIAIYDNNKNVMWDSLSPVGVINSAVSQVFNCPGGGNYYISTNVVLLDSNASSNNNFYNGCQINISSTYTYDSYYGAVYFPPPPPYSGDGDQTNRNIYNASVAAYNAYVNNYNTNEKSNYIMLAAMNQFNANIVSYNGSTRTATLDKVVDISMGYNTRYGTLNSSYNIIGTVDNIAGAISMGNAVPRLSTNENGDFVGVFKVPGSVFWSGQRIFRVDNRNNPSDPSTATTFAQGTFLAGSNQNITTLSSSVDSAALAIQPISYPNAVQTTPLPAGITDPLAQSFIVSKDNYPNGIFISDVKLFFGFPPGAKTTADLNNMLTSAVNVYIVQCVNGYPNGTSLPHSIVTKIPSDIIPYVSATPHYLDPTTYVTFTFDAPVYIEAGVLYAIVIQSSCSEYYLYYAEQNKPVWLSSYKNLPTDANPPTGVTPNVGAAPYVGALFESQNAITWTADQTKDLMFIVDKCNFNLSNPTIPFVVPAGLPYRKLGHQDIAYTVNPNLVKSTFKTYSPDLFVDSINVTTSDFIPSLTSINYTYQSTLASNLTLTSPVAIYPGKFGSPTQDNIYFDDGLGARYLTNSSNNSFVLNATLTSTDANVSPVISDDFISVNVINNYINNMGISNNVISIVNGGVGYNVTNVAVTCSSPDIGTDQAFFNCNLDANGTITNVNCYYHGSGYVTTPTLYVTGGNTSQATITVTGESNAKGGNAYTRYFTKPVVLAPGNDSGDLRVFYTAYKPYGSSVYVYYRILNSNDTSKLDDQKWQLMTQISGINNYSTSRTDFIEFECAPGLFLSGQANNNIAYTSTNGQSYNTFIQFEVKIVLATSDPTKVPVLSDMRAIALPSGTGL